MYIYATFLQNYVAILAFIFIQSQLLTIASKSYVKIQY